MKINTNLIDGTRNILFQVKFDDETGFEIVQEQTSDWIRKSAYGIYKETDGSLYRMELKDFMEIIRLGLKYKSEFKRYKIYNNKIKETEIVEEHNAQKACDKLGWMSGYCSIEILEKQTE